MKKILIVSFLLLSLFSFSGCEKDDICDANTATTPRLVITVYDITNPSILKNVTNMKVIGENMADGIVFNTATDGSQYLTNGNTVSIPLRTDSDSTTYSFILNYENPNPNFVNEDKITFNYTRQNIFVSRACGYKTVFTLDVSNPFTQTAVPITNPKWMQYVSVQTNNIVNENETHIKVFF